MKLSTADSDRQHQIRELRMRIGRLRRQIDSRAHATRRSGQELLDWRTYVRCVPGLALMGALGLGLILSAGWARRRMSRWIGRRLIRQTTRQFLHFLAEQSQEIWSASTSQRANDGADHE